MIWRGHCGIPAKKIGSETLPVCEVGTKPTTNRKIRFATLFILYVEKREKSIRFQVKSGFFSKKAG